MNLKKLFGDRPFWHFVAKLAIPVAIQNLLTSSFQLVDTLMVSRLGDVTLSAVGMAAQWGWLCNLLGFGLASGMSVFISQYWGIKDHKGIRRVLGMGIVSCLILTLCFTAIAFFSPEFVLRLFNKDPAVIEAGCKYLRLVSFSYPAVILTNILATVLRNTERVKLPMYVAGITTVLNIFVDYGLIFGKFGLPELGVEGAALATCISSWLGPVFLLLFSWFEKNLLIGPVKDLFAFGRKNVAAFLSRAMPVVFNEGLWALGTIILNMIYSNQGYEYYAGVTIFRTFSDLAFAFYVGLGNACVIMVGKSVGKGNIRIALDDAARFTMLGPLLGLIVGGLCIIFRHPLVALFATGSNLSPLTISTALAVTVFCSAEVAFRNLPYIHVVGVFRSGGDTLRGMIYDLISLWALSIPAALIAANVLHLPFIYILAAAYLGEDVPKSIMCMRHFLSRRWLKPVTKEGQAGLAAFREEETRHE